MSLLDKIILFINDVLNIVMKLELIVLLFLLVIFVAHLPLIVS